METKETNQGGYIGSAKIQGTTADNSAILVSETTKPNVGTTIERLTTYNDNGTIAIPYTPTENPKLKNVTQQKRVELIETQKWELIAATATIDNQAATIADLEKTMAKMEKFRLDTIRQNDELSETCGNLVRTKMRNDSTIADLTKRNGNLKTITNDQTERIEFLEHSLKTVCDKLEKSEKQCGFLITDKSDLQDELKNYELAIGRIETENKKINELSSKAVESRERFIFLVLTNVVSIAWGVYLLLTK